MAYTKERQAQYRRENKEHLNAYGRKWRENNPDKVALKVHTRETRFDWLTVYKQSRGCSKCGFWHAAALQFHHRDPSAKLYDARDLVQISKQKMIDELAKCDVICANCHFLLHATEA